MKNFDYDAKKARERAWYEQGPKEKQSLVSRLMHHRIVFEPQRNAFNYVFPKEQMSELVRSRLACKGVSKVDRLLIAPCGTGDDLKYLADLALEVYGIDLSPIAVMKCPGAMKAKVGDILDSGYADETFDLIVAPLFFHHVAKVGFDPFLREFRRILVNGGAFATLEPSVWYPLNAITRPLKRILRNPYGEVEDEDPFRPGLMLDCLKRCGYTNIEFRAATYSHCSFYVPLAKIVNYFTEPLFGLWPFKYLSWLVVYYAEKGATH